MYVQRDCNPPSDRDSYVKELMKYIKIDSYGPCLNNKKFPANTEGFHNFESETFYELLSKYKFNLAFENAICDGYMTEKLFRPLKVGSVPVYFGSPLAVWDWMPNDKSVILVSDFSSPEDLADYLNDLNDDDHIYESYLVHKIQGGINNKVMLDAIEQRPWKVLGEWDEVNFGHRMYAGYECYVCDQLYKWNNSLAEHLEDATVPAPPAKFADNSHMGCPEPQSSVASGIRYPQHGPYWQGLHEAKALYEMVTNEETDSRKFIGKYLKMSTDKYAVPKEEL